MTIYDQVLISSESGVERPASAAADASVVLRSLTAASTQVTAGNREYVQHYLRNDTEQVAPATITFDDQGHGRDADMKVFTGPRPNRTSYGAAVEGGGVDLTVAVGQPVNIRLKPFSYVCFRVRYTWVPFAANVGRPFINVAGYAGPGPQEVDSTQPGNVVITPAAGIIP